jgi:RNA 3'-terminal phosphate cyclase
MTEVAHPPLHWTEIRRTLSLALLRQMPEKISGGGSFLASNPSFQPLYDTIAQALLLMDGGELRIAGGDIHFTPRPLTPGIWSIDTGPFGSMTDCALFLMPALFTLSHRSVLNFTGVSHGFPHPTSFVRETLLGALESCGLYGSMMLKRFGFYGSGGGAAECRVYPREAGRGTVVPLRCTDIMGVKIFLSRLGAELGETQKEEMVRELSIDPARVSIITVVDAEGPGNSVQVYCTAAVGERTVPVVISRELPMYNETGKFILTEEVPAMMLRDLVSDVRQCLGGGGLPDCIAGELEFFSRCFL